MYKKISFVFIIIGVIFILSGCNFPEENDEKGRKDTIEIYNSDNEKILESNG